MADFGEMEEKIIADGTWTDGEIKAFLIGVSVGEGRRPSPILDLSDSNLTKDDIDKLISQPSQAIHVVPNFEKEVMERFDRLEKLLGV